MVRTSCWPAPDSYATEALSRQRFAHGVAAEVAETPERPVAVVVLPGTGGVDIRCRWPRLKNSG